MSLEAIRSMIRAEHATLLDEARQKLEGVIDARLADQEARFMKEISALQKRTEQLELRDTDRTDENDDPAVQETKRRRRSVSVETGNVGMEKSARDHASLRRHDDEERHTVVFSGFPAKSRKKLLIYYVKLQLPVVERLAGHADLLDLGDNVFAPGIRTSVAMISSSEQGCSVQVLECLETGRRGRTHFQIWR